MIEQERLERISKNPLYAAGVNRYMVDYSFEVFSRYMRPGATLELGPAEGVMTDRLVECSEPLTVVEGSSTFCANLRVRHPGITVINSLFESFEPQGSFKNILLGHVLEHVEEPEQILRRCGTWLDDDGIILAAVIMGLLPYESALNDADRQHGHRRVFDPESFRRCFNEAGLALKVFGGYWLKPVSNSQLEQSWNEDMLLSFMRLGERYPDIAAEIYVVATAHAC